MQPAEVPVATSQLECRVAVPGSVVEERITDAVGRSITVGRLVELAAFELKIADVAVAASEVAPQLAIRRVRSDQPFVDLGGPAVSGHRVGLLPDGLGERRQSEVGLSQVGLRVGETPPLPLTPR